MFLMNCNRLDIAYAVNTLSMFPLNPKSRSSNSIIGILRYIKGTMYYKVRVKGHLHVLEGYSGTN